MDLATKLAKVCLRVKQASAEALAPSVVSDTAGLPEVTPESLRDTFEESLQEEKILRGSAKHYMQLANRRAMDNDQSGSDAFFSRLLPVPWSGGEAAWRLPAIAASGYAGHLAGKEMAKSFRDANPDAVQQALMATEKGDSPIAQEAAARLEQLAGPGKVVKYPAGRIQDVLAPGGGKPSPLIERLMSLDPSVANLPPEVTKGVEDTHLKLKSEVQKEMDGLEAAKKLRSKILPKLMEKLDAADLAAGAIHAPDADYAVRAAFHQGDAKIRALAQHLARTERVIDDATVKQRQANRRLTEFGADPMHQQVLGTLNARKTRLAELTPFINMQAQLAHENPEGLESIINNEAAGPKDPRFEVYRRELRDLVNASTKDKPLKLREMGPTGVGLNELLSGIADKGKEDVSSVVNAKNILFSEQKRQLRSNVLGKLKALNLPPDTLDKLYRWVADSEKGWKPENKLIHGLGIAGGVGLGGALTGLPMAIRAAKLNRTGGELAQKARLRARKAMERSDKEQFRRENILRALEGSDTLPRNELKNNIRTKRKAWREGLRNDRRVASMASGDSKRMLESFQNAGAEKQGALDTIHRILD